jgi:hypothetical protein
LATLATSEGVQGIFSKITFLKSVLSNKKDEVCHSFLVKNFTKSLHRGGVVGVASKPVQPRSLSFTAKIQFKLVKKSSSSN